MSIGKAITDRRKLKIPQSPAAQDGQVKVLAIYSLKISKRKELEIC